MSEVISIVYDYMSSTYIPIDFNGSGYVFTFWDLFCGTILVHIGIYVVYKITGH